MLQCVMKPKCIENSQEEVKKIIMEMIRVQKLLTSINKIIWLLSHGDHLGFPNIFFDFPLFFIFSR